MGIISTNDDSCFVNESCSDSKENTSDDDSVCSSDEFHSSCDLEALVFLKNLITSCYPEEVENCSERPCTGVCHMIRAIKILRQIIQSDTKDKRLAKKQKRTTKEMNKVDFEWVNLVLEFLHSKELRSAMEAIGCASIEGEENDSDSSQCTCYLRSEMDSARSTLTYPRSRNFSLKRAIKKLQKTEGFMPHQCKAHTSSKNIKKLRLADVKYLQRHPSTMKTKGTQTHNRLRNLVLSTTSSSDDSCVSDAYPHDEENIIYCPNPYQKSSIFSQSTKINPLTMDNKFKSSNAQENVIEVSQVPTSDPKIPLYISFPQLHFQVQRNVSTQTEVKKNINLNNRQSRIYSEVTAARTEQKRNKSHKKASKHERRGKKYSFNTANEICKNENPMTDSKPKILSPSRNQDVNNTSETVSTNSMDQDGCYSPEENNSLAPDVCVSASLIKCPEIKQACLGQRTLSAAFENYVLNKSGRYETVTESPEKSSFSNDENQSSRSDAAKTTTLDDIALSTKLDEHDSALVTINMVQIQDNDLNFPLKQISLSRDSPRQISISLEVSNDIPKGGSTKPCLTKDSRENSYASKESVIPEIENVPISAASMKFETASKATQEEIPTQTPPDPEELNSSALQSRIVSACRKRKYSRSSLEVGQQPTPSCTLTKQHRPTPFSCHSSKTDQTSTVSERKRSPTPPADDCVSRQREGRNKRRKHRKGKDEKCKHNLTLPPEGEKESEKGTDNSDKTPGMVEEESSHEISFPQPTNSDTHLRKSRSIALSPVNFGKSVDKTKRKEMLQKMCNDILYRDHDHKSLRRSLEAQIPEENSVTTERDNPCTEMAIHMLMWQKDFFKTHLQRLSKICDVLSKENPNPKSSGSSEFEDKRRHTKRLKRKRRYQRERLCQALGHCFPLASDWNDGALSLSSSSTSENAIGSYPLWWEPAYAIACRNVAKNRPRKRRASRAVKRDKTKSEYEYSLSDLFARAK